MTTQAALAEIRQLLRALGERCPGGPGCRATAPLRRPHRSPRFDRHVRVDHIRTAGGLVRCAWIDDWGALIGDQELCLAGIEKRMLRLAASLAPGHPGSLYEELTVGLGPRTPAGSPRRCSSRPARPAP